MLALLWTLTVETTGMWVWARIAYTQPWRAVAASLVANLVVHTLFWYSQPFFARFDTTGLYIAELLVVVIEGTIYARMLQLPGATPWLLSALLNLASFLTGLWLWQSIIVVSAIVPLNYGLTPGNFCHTLVCSIRVQ